MDQTKNILTLVRDLFDVKEDFIPLHVPYLNGNEKNYLNECIDSTFVSSVGKFVNLFEDKIAEYTKANHAIVCVNGTNALHLSLLLVGVEKGDEVITQPLTFIATTNSITYANATPVFVDVDKDTMGMSPKSLIEFLEENAELRDGVCYNKITKNRIKACMPMHTFGHACRIEEIVDVCKKYNIELVEDAAEAMGSIYKGKHLGTFGRISAISFNGNKIMTTGGGGIILTNDNKLAAKAKHLSTQSKVPHKWEYVHDDIGFNYRMPNINAALGLAQLENLDFFLENKRKLAKEYSTFFKNSSVDFFEERESEQCNFWLNAIILNNKEERDSFLEESNKKGIMTRPIWQLMNKLPMYKDNFKGDLTNSEWLEERVVNIPSSVRALK
ncbi:aminotransferase DegT [Tenacibaculum sp. SZ-18]|uniref:LegC family aminotransferase n=1 Tax=Tenacibaculum sp. SZ-18 TaxID=754423 RepID=UPI000C2D0FEA|nr:LegC family aminotransferase [Tenacibaculum sp. SZ-18]AUC14162.1 aminotransferase DegT [Tenacibaculum sp. SZ-18]